MRHIRIVSIITALTAIALAITSRPAQAQVFDFTPSDWLSYRSDMLRSGGNGDPGLGAKNLRRVYVYPPTADMPAEMVVDNDVLPPISTQFAVNGAWVYPAFSDRAPGAWPFTAPDTTPDKLADYVWAEPIKNATLATIGLTTLSSLPNLGTNADAAATYDSINQ